MKMYICNVTNLCRKDGYEGSYQINVVKIAVENWQKDVNSSAHEQVEPKILK